MESCIEQGCWADLHLSSYFPVCRGSRNTKKITLNPLSLNKDQLQVLEKIVSFIMWASQFCWKWPQQVKPHQKNTFDQRLRSEAQRNAKIVFQQVKMAGSPSNMVHLFLSEAFCPRMVATLFPGFIKGLEKRLLVSFFWIFLYLLFLLFLLCRHKLVVMFGMRVLEMDNWVCCVERLSA